MNSILIVEDEDIIRAALKKLLERNQYQVDEAASVEDACLLDLNSFDMIISDLRLPGAPGTELIEKASATPVLIMTSYASLRSAVDSMKLGAVDYIAKPFDHNEMVETVTRIITENTATKPAKPSAASGSSNTQPIGGMLGSSPSMHALFKTIEKVALTDTTVLIQGESGTGKELVAKSIHTLGARQKAPMISVNCAAIPESLIESELFGHIKGAFTGANSDRSGLIEAADGGTLLLDEIGELPIEAQARLLRVLQEGEVRRLGAVTPIKVNVRLISATHRDLSQMVADKQFRQDLYYRINVMPLMVPPLRERGNDSLEIATAILSRLCDKFKRPNMDFTKQAIQAICDHNWPGNVRELENAIERAIVLSDNDQIDADHLGLSPTSDAQQSSAMEATKALSMEDYFVHFVSEHEASMNETELAKKLGISRKSLWERRQRFGIPRNRSR
ncbi:MAG: sigma-54-dependent Fis family transcriptional regulator [Pseudomonadales bacterium]|nr:sigma-54-dependent Fis family transcriptional regulator [Pseudomonadales bacterium]